MLKPVVTYHDVLKTKIKERYFVDENGQKSGLYERFYSDDKSSPYQMFNYEGGVLHGSYEWRSIDGVTREKCTYHHGKKDGLYQRFHGNTVLAEECTYQNDVKDGAYQLIDEENWPIKVGVYVNGQFFSDTEWLVKQAFRRRMVHKIDTALALAEKEPKQTPREIAAEYRSVIGPVSKEVRKLLKTNPFDRQRG